MKIETRHYDSGKSEAQIYPHSYGEVTAELEKYDRYVDDIGDEEGNNLICDVRKWIEENFAVHPPDSSVAHALIRSIHGGGAVDITPYI